MARQTQYTAEEWEILAGLPQLITVAAISAEKDDPQETIREGIAGLRGILSGARARTELVRFVVADFDGDRDEQGNLLPIAHEFTNRQAGIAMTLEQCRKAVHILAAKATPEEAAEYREWLVTIAQDVCAAVRSGGVFGLGGTRISPAEEEFINKLATTLQVELV